MDYQNFKAKMPLWIAVEHYYYSCNNWGHNVQTPYPDFFSWSGYGTTPNANSTVPNSTVLTTAVYSVKAPCHRCDESCSEMRSQRGFAVCTSQHWRHTCSLVGSSVRHRCSKLHLAGDSSPTDQRLTYSKYCHLDTHFVRQDRRHSSMRAAFCWEG